MQPPGSSTFQLYDAELASTADEPLLGLWDVGQTTTLPRESTHSMPSFDPRTAAPPPSQSIPVWRATLSSNVHQAQRHLARGEERIRASQRALAEAPARLDTLVAAANSSGIAGLSFDTRSMAQPLPAPEAELHDALYTINRQPERSTHSFTTAPGGQPAESVPEGWREGMARFQRVLQRVRSVVLQYALVETVIADQVIGRTVIGWSGDAHTTWSPRLQPEQIALHWRMLDMSLESRQTFINTFVIVSQGLFKLAVLVSHPGGVVLALPALWKFINTIIAEHQIVKR